MPGTRRLGHNTHRQGPVRATTTAKVFGNHACVVPPFPPPKLCELCKEPLAPYYRSCERRRDNTVVTIPLQCRIFVNWKRRHIEIARSQPQTVTPLLPEKEVQTDDSQLKLSKQINSKHTANHGPAGSLLWSHNKTCETKCQKKLKFRPRTRDQNPLRRPHTTRNQREEKPWPLDQIVTDPD